MAGKDFSSSKMRGVRPSKADRKYAQQKSKMMNILAAAAILGMLTGSGAAINEKFNKPAHQVTKRNGGRKNTYRKPVNKVPKYSVTKKPQTEIRKPVFVAPVIKSPVTTPAPERRPVADQSKEALAMIDRAEKMAESAKFGAALEKVRRAAALPSSDDIQAKAETLAKEFEIFHNLTGGIGVNELAQSAGQMKILLADSGKWMRVKEESFDKATQMYTFRTNNNIAFPMPKSKIEKMEKAVPSCRKITLYTGSSAKPPKSSCSKEIFEILCQP